MTDTLSPPVQSFGGAGDEFGPNGRDHPTFSWVEHADRSIPLLQLPGAQTIARDRWERLDTRHQIPVEPERVWKALTDPSHLKEWLAVCHGSLLDPNADCILDFEDGEFFLCRPQLVRPPLQLQYLWRWLGVGYATSVTWTLAATDTGTSVSVVEEAFNPPSDWQTWNGGGWPGILDQLAAYLRTGTNWRWPWRRMGPYVPIELPLSIYEAWDRLFAPHALKYWLQPMSGSLEPDQAMTILMGDASGTVGLNVREVVQPGQIPPSFLPWVSFSLQRSVWNAEVIGRLWLEPAGWGRSLLQVFLFNWENVAPALQLSERRIQTDFWVGAMRRARLLCSMPSMPAAPHTW
jgi:uncharacterized protein YndB with AHSA1/START domain